MARRKANHYSSDGETWRAALSRAASNVRPVGEAADQPQHTELLAALQSKQEATDRKVDKLQESLQEIKMLLKKEHWSYRSNQEREQEQEQEHVPHELWPEPEPELQAAHGASA